MEDILILLAGKKHYFGMRIFSLVLVYSSALIEYGGINIRTRTCESTYKISHTNCVLVQGKMWLCLPAVHQVTSYPPSSPIPVVYARQGHELPVDASVLFHIDRPLVEIDIRHRTGYVMSVEHIHDGQVRPDLLFRLFPC